MAKIHGRRTFGRHITLDIRIGVKEENGEKAFESVPARLRILGFDIGEKLATRLPEPMPPLIPLRDGKGPLRDKNGEVVYDIHKGDPKYREEKAHHETLMAVAMFTEALDDPGWEFATEKPEESAPSGEWRAYYDALLQELRDDGFPVMAMRDIAESARWIAGAKQEDIEEAKRSF